MLLSRAVAHLQPCFIGLYPSYAGPSSSGGGSSRPRSQYRTPALQRKRTSNAASNNTSSKKRKDPPPLPTRRQSPRLQELEQQRQRTGPPENILPRIEESSPNHGISQLTYPENMGESQDNTVIPGTKTQGQGGWSPQRGAGASTIGRTPESQRNPLGLTPESQESPNLLESQVDEHPDYGNNEDVDSFNGEVDLCFGRFGEEAAECIYERPFHERLAWCSKEAQINNDNRPAFEACLVIEAGTLVSNEGEKPSKERMPLY